MVDFTSLNLPGASALYNKIAAKVHEIDTKLLISANLTSSASDMKAMVEADLIDLKSIVEGMIPELPTAPTLNLQAEITALSGLTAGSSAYTAKLASIGTSFGSAITAGGYDINSIATTGASALAGATGSLAAVIPNMELPPGATEAIEVAKGVLQPTVDALEEAASKFSTDKTEDVKKGIFGDAVATKSLEENMAAIEAKMKPYADAFESKAKRWEQQLKEYNATAREEETRSI